MTLTNVWQCDGHRIQNNKHVETLKKIGSFYNVSCGSKKHIFLMVQPVLLIKIATRGDRGNCVSYIMYNVDITVFEQVHTYTHNQNTAHN